MFALLYEYVYHFCLFPFNLVWCILCFVFCILFVEYPSKCPQIIYAAEHNIALADVPGTGIEAYRTHRGSV